MAFWASGIPFIFYGAPTRAITSSAGHEHVVPVIELRTWACIEYALALGAIFWPLQQLFSIFFHFKYCLRDLLLDNSDEHVN